MLRATLLRRDTMKETFHRISLPRRVELQRHIRNTERRARLAATAGRDAEAVVPYRYNRWWVNSDHEFVHQYAVVEDPDVTRERRRALPSAATADELWREPKRTYFLPFQPFVRVVDYAKDADAKFMKPVNMPRWKDYMLRQKPCVPRTWY